MADALVGRNAELESVRALVAAVSHGRGGLAWVDGEPGIGKSSLVTVGLAGADALGVRVFHAVGDELTSAIALRYLVDALLPADRDDGFRSDIADVLAGRGASVDVVSTASEKILALVERECARSPVILVADDVQWADEASLALWRSLARVTEQTPLLLVAAGRRVPHRHEVARLRLEIQERPGAVVVDLAPLDNLAVDQIAAAILGAPVGPNLRHSLASAGGNPLYVREVVESLVREDLVRTDDGTADIAGEIGPDLMSLHAAIGRRLQFLSGEARSVLRVGAILGARFSASELATMSGHTVPQVLPLLEEALLAGVLADSTADLMFRHPLIRQALHDEVPASIRSALHAYAAESLADAGASWTRVARHLLAMSEGIDGWALDWLMAIPAAALYTQPAVAAELLARARQAIPGDPRHGLLTARLTAVLWLLRRADDLVAVCNEALEAVTDPALVGEIAWNLGRGYQMLSGRAREGVAALGRILAGPDTGRPWRSRLLAQKALLLATAGSANESAAEARLAMRAGEEDHDPVTVGWALNALLKTAGRPEALEIVERGLAVVSSGDDPELTDLRFLFMANRLVTLQTLNRSDDYDAALGPTIALAERVGTPRLIEVQRSASKCYFVRGDWDQALLYADQIEPRTHQQALAKHGLAARIYIHRGNPAMGEAHLAAVADIPYTHEVDFVIAAVDVITARALLAESAGDLRGAVEIMSAWLAPDVDSNLHARHVRQYQMLVLARIGLKLGDRDLAQAVLAAVAPYPGVDREYVLVADACRALIADDPESLNAAADYFEATGQPRESGFGAEEAAVRLAARGDTSAARVAFRRAVAVYEQLGALLDLRRVRARLRPFGIRTGSRTAHRRTATGWDALTPTERGVAALVAEGHSNPEIATRLYVSRRTVEAHVAHILHKLDLRTRTDVWREAARHSRGEQPDGLGSLAAPKR